MQVGRYNAGFPTRVRKRFDGTCMRMYLDCQHLLKDAETMNGSPDKENTDTGLNTLAVADLH